MPGWWREEEGRLLYQPLFAAAAAATAGWRRAQPRDAAKTAVLVRLCRLFVSRLSALAVMYIPYRSYLLCDNLLYLV